MTTDSKGTRQFQVSAELVNSDGEVMDFGPECLLILSLETGKVEFVDTRSRKLYLRLHATDGSTFQDQDRCDIANHEHSPRRDVSVQQVFALAQIMSAVSGWQLEIDWSNPNVVTLRPVPPPSSDGGQVVQFPGSPKPWAS